MPEKFTFPFYYEPHELARIAVSELQDYLDGFENWFFDLNLGPENYQHPLGKMFGVLVVKDKDGNLGYLCAYSGVITGEQQEQYFVPLVFNMFNEDSVYAQKSAFLAALNKRIKLLENNSDFLNLDALLNEAQINRDQKITAEKTKQQEQKQERKKERELAENKLNPSEYELLVSQHKQVSMATKFMIKEYAIYLDQKVDVIQTQRSVFTNQLKQLKTERKELSHFLQEWIFRNYKFLNAHGENRDALELFKNKPPYLPPSGTGDCAAPKLLQYAYKNGLEPIAMAEFWYGESLKSQIRKHGHFYPSCRSKCEPVLNFMLQGLDVDPNPMLENPAVGKDLPFIYEDEHLFAVNKPAEFLSVRGKTIDDSVEHRMRLHFPDATGPLIVHRLDMSTSGILVGTKSLEVHKKLQEQFEKRTLTKKYIAVLEGIVPEDTGFIDLPLRVDLDNRPFQLVDEIHGKNARTRYEVLERTSTETRIAFYPITGRTHQLRVHAAHPLGLNCPIKGDDLYGYRADRLYLHAETLIFKHPVTEVRVHLHIPAPF